MLDLRSFESAGVSIVDVFEGRGQFESGRLDAGGQPAVLPPQPLAFDQQRQAGFEIQVRDVILAPLFFQGLRHALQTQGIKFIEALSQEHGVSQV